MSDQHCEEPEVDRQRQDGAWNGWTRVPWPSDSWDLPVQYHFCSLEHLVEVTRSCLDLSRGVTCLHLGFLRPSFAVVVCLFFFCLFVLSY